MREHQTDRPRVPWRRHPWFKRISNAIAHLSAATVLVASVPNGLARKHKSRRDHQDRRDHAERDRDGGKDRDQEDKRDNDPKADRRPQREDKDRSDGDSDGGNSNRGGKQERHTDDSRGAHSVASEQDATATPTPTPTPTPSGGNNNGGGGGGGGNGGRGDGGGNDAGNAGSGFFDSPLATKARRRAKDFDNADRNDEDDRTVADVDPDGESVYETDSVALITGPDGLEIVTDNITYFAEPTPTPEPLPALELPVREPGFPFGEDFPFGNTAVAVAPPATEPSDPGDTGTAPVDQVEPVPTTGEPDPASSDGGDNTMDFAS